jgi:hypothetical protein
MIESFHDENGKVGLKILGGAVFQNESNPSQPKWTVQVYMGYNPDNEDSRLFIKTTNPDQNKDIQVAFDINGDLSISTSGKTIVQAEGNVEVTSSGNVVVVGSEITLN